MYAILFESSTEAMFEIVSDLVNSVLKLCGMFINIIIDICKQLGQKTWSWIFPIGVLTVNSVEDFRCECNTIKILMNRTWEITKNVLIKITFFTKGFVSQIIVFTRIRAWQNLTEKVNAAWSQHVLKPQSTEELHFVQFVQM